MQIVHRLRIVAIAIAAFAGPAAAYQIGSHVPTKEFYDLHETFTALAGECLGDEGRWPQDCHSLFPQIERRMSLRQAEPANNVEYASRWPDDPTRMLDRDPSKIRAGLQFQTDCQRALRAGRAIDNAGLFCSSHYGRLQFLHAQASAEERGDNLATRRNILAWAMFAFDAATDENFRGENYCDAINRLEGADNRGLRDALTFSDESLCRPRRSWFLGIIPTGTYAAWTVGTMFALHCPNPVQERICWERTGEYGDESARFAAVGALLHLVQDSYSQSHVARVPEGERAPGPRGPFVARVVCRSPARYYDYQEQNAELPDDRGEIVSDPHRAADFPPTLDASCAMRDRPVHDVITASAAVLHYVRTRDKTGLRSYLETHVFPT